MPILSHKEEVNPIIWRYINLTKFISMLHKQALFFTYIDKLDDIYEGTYTHTFEDDLRKEFHHLNQTIFKTPATNEQIEENIRVFKVSAAKLRRITCVNCWHERKEENALMWKAYAFPGIAIKSSYEKLHSVFNKIPQDITIAEVNYADYENAHLHPGNTNIPFIFKKTQYSDEKEIRILHEKNIGDYPHNAPQDEIDIGQYIKVDLQELIDEIIVSPNSPDWFFDLIKSLNEKYGLNKPIKKSSL